MKAEWCMNGGEHNALQQCQKFAAMPQDGSKTWQHGVQTAVKPRLKEARGACWESEASIGAVLGMGLCVACSVKVS